MNIERLRQVQETLRVEGQVDMDFWVAQCDSTSCGTAGCIAGWAIINEGIIDAAGVINEANEDVKALIDEGRWYRNLNGWSPVSGSSIALSFHNAARLGSRLLDLTADQAHELFEPSYWPTDWRNRYLNAARGCERSRVVYDYIDWFIEKEREPA